MRISLLPSERKRLGEATDQPREAGCISCDSPGVDNCRDPNGLKAVEIMFSIFFFQAEDGIRDLTVTGVQTCALPISAVLVALALVACVRPVNAQSLADRISGVRDGVARFHFTGKPGMCGDGATMLGRSEERRVGKECRSRWSADQ